MFLPTVNAAIPEPRPLSSMHARHLSLAALLPHLFIHYDLLFHVLF